jgi:AcrR family transcriptional regulator
MMDCQYLHASAAPLAYGEARHNGEGFGNVAATATKPGRSEQRRLRTRAQLLRAAYRLMSEKGVDATSIQEITEAADVGFGTFYNYFASKDDLATQVLDCVIGNIGRRNDLVTQAMKLTDPVEIVATSVRCVAREMMTNAVWYWWVKRPDLIVERMRAGFRPFGMRDMRRAIKAGAYAIAEDDLDTACSTLIWLLAGGIKDIVDGHRPAKAEGLIADAVLRVMGVPLKAARKVSRAKLPPYPALAIDFDFVLEGEAAAA